MLKRKKKIIIGLIVILLAGIFGYVLFFPAPSPPVTVIGQLEPRDLKKIQALVRRHLWSARVEHVWHMLLDGDIKRIPERIRHDGQFQMTRIVAQPDGSVSVEVSSDALDADYSLLLNHTNGWRIYKKATHSP
jgi:hypothetical protein